MWSSRLFWKLFLVYAGFSITLATGLPVVVTMWGRAQIEQQNERRLLDTAILLRSHVEELVVTAASGTDEARASAREQLQSLLESLATQTETRITLVDNRGDVLADTERDPARMLNHADRPELIAAGKSEPGTATRRSPTLEIDMLYLALPVRRNGELAGFVRVATELETINQRVAAIRTFLWLFALAVGLTVLLLTYFMVGRIIRPLSELTRGALAIASGKEKHPVNISGKDEIGLLAAAFNKMQRKLSTRVGQLRANSERLSTVLSSMDEGIIAVDAEENVLLANEAGRELLGFATPDVVGRPLLEVTRSLAVREVVQSTLNKQDACHREFEATGASRRIVSLRATRLPGDPCPGVVAVLHDVTDLRRLENLRQEFVANVSHELKTPLASIKAYAETLRLGAINDSKNNLKFVERIEQEADRLYALILDLLQIARVESGQESFEITEVAVRDVAESSAARHRDFARDKQIQLEIGATSEPLLVKADEDGLLTIFDNLIDNAIKYTPAGGRVSVHWYGEGDQAVIEISDSGIGIAHPDQPRIFERFYRIDRARSRELGGTGLGLSIVKHLVQSFGGSVSVQSEPGKGSSFKVRLARP